jgi:hypothetical protein
VVRRKAHTTVPDGDALRQFRNAFSAMNAILFGQSGFFSPNTINAWFAQRRLDSHFCRHFFIAVTF